MIKNVCAPAVVLGERIVIVGGESEQNIARLGTNLASLMEKGSLTDRRSARLSVQSYPSSSGSGDNLAKFFPHLQVSSCRFL